MVWFCIASPGDDGLEPESGQSEQELDIREVANRGAIVGFPYQSQSLTLRLMTQLSRVAMWAATAVLAIYFPAALWLKHTYVPLEEPKGTVFRLISFQKLSRNGFGYLSIDPRLRDLADTPDEPQRSLVILFENEKPLGPAHSSQEDIEGIGLVARFN